MARRAVNAPVQRTVFVSRQNRALRAALREVKRTRKLSQVALGDLLGTTQQNIGRLLTSTVAGFSYDSATRLVRALGYEGVDAFFQSKGISVPADIAAEDAST